MALQRLRNDPEAGWELRNRTPLWGPDFLMVSQDCKTRSLERTRHEDHITDSYNGR